MPMEEPHFQGREDRYGGQPQEEAAGESKPDPHPEPKYFTEKREMRKSDFDHDGLDDYEETNLGTDSTKADSDGDGIQDGWERGLGTNPLEPDTDGDGAGDREELINRENPKVKDRPRPPAHLQEEELGGNTVSPGPLTGNGPFNAISTDMAGVTAVDDVFETVTPVGNDSQGAFGARIDELMKSFSAPGDGGEAPSGESMEAQVTLLRDALSAVPPAEPSAARPTGEVGGVSTLTSPAGATVPSTVGRPEPNLNGETTLHRTFQDGSTQTIVIDKNGQVSRTTERVNPSTGAKVTDTRAADGSSRHEEVFPNGASIGVQTYPDGSTERWELVKEPNGSVTMNSTDRQGQVTVTEQGDEPDGTTWVRTTLPDGRTELRTAKQTVQPDGSIVNETTGPDGNGRELASTGPDGGTRIEYVFTEPDGRKSTSVRESKPDGSAVQTITNVDGHRETIDTEIVPGGTREVWTRDDGFSQTKTTKDDGNGHIEVEIIAPDRVSRSSTDPDGTGQTVVTYSDGTNELSVTGDRPDGTLWSYTKGRDDAWERVEFPPGGPTTIGRSDGTTIKYSSDDDISIFIRRPDGTDEITEMTLDGAGTTMVIDRNSHILSETRHEAQPVEPFPDLSESEAVPILSPDAFDQLNERGVVGPGVDGAPPTAGPDPDADPSGNGASPDLTQADVTSQPSATTDAPDDILGVEPDLVTSVDSTSLSTADAADGSLGPEVTEFEVETVAVPESPVEDEVAFESEPVVKEEWPDPSYAAEPDGEAEPVSDATGGIDE